MPEKEGVLIPGAAYTTKALGRIGIGREQLRRARAAGVNSVMMASARWYFADSLIAWMVEKSQQDAVEESNSRDQ